LSINKNRKLKYISDSSGIPTQQQWDNIFFSDRVNLIVYNQGNTFNDGSNRVRSEVQFEHVQIPHQLSLHTDEGEYVIGNQEASKAELYWLGKEISDFLGLELLFLVDN